MDAQERARLWQEQLAHYRHVVPDCYLEIHNEFCCDECRAVPAFIPIELDIVFPIPTCTRTDGCLCLATPVICSARMTPEQCLQRAHAERVDRIARQRVERQAREDRDAIISGFWRKADEMREWYRQRNDDPYALNKAIAAAKEQIELGPVFIEQRRKDYGDDVDLPQHAGYKQLAILAEQEWRFDDGIDLCRRAMSEGWDGDWLHRINRMTAKKRRHGIMA